VTACQQPGGTTQSRTACKNACNNSFTTSCGSPGQYSASYAVNKVNDKPKLSLVQGGTAADGSLALRAATGALSVVAACVVALVLV